MGTQSDDRDIDGDSGQPPMTQDSPGTINARAAGASLIQVELGLGKNAIILLWLSCLVTGIAIAGLVANYAAYKTVSAQYQVLQYDHQALKAQLVAKGLYEGTEH